MLDLTDEQDKALRTARFLLDLGHPLAAVFASQLIPAELREWARVQVIEESNRTFERVRVIATAESENDWLATLERSNWHYWPTLRRFLLAKKNWPRDTVGSLDDASDQVLSKLAAGPSGRQEEWHGTAAPEGVVRGRVRRHATGPASPVHRR